LVKIFEFLVPISNHKKLNQMYFPKNLHYVRFTAKKAQNMREFELACQNADKIYLNKHKSWPGDKVRRLKNG